MHPLVRCIAAADPVRAHGFVRSVGSGVVRASGPAMRLGQLCHIEADVPVTAEVVAIDAGGVTVVPLDRATDIRLGARVEAGPTGAFPVGDGFAGRAVDALGRPIDGAGPVRHDDVRPAAPALARPLDRVSPSTPLATGLRAIDGLLTLGIGQRIGIFAASGVGKTSLVELLAAQVRCDRAVVCLIGERGREVTAFWESLPVGHGGTRATLVAATSDESPAMRARAADQALALAEHWRAQGEHVLLLLDSATRLAMALREIGLAAGAPPTVRAYTPNVFTALPRLVERCGALRSGGAITAVMTVLTETDDNDDPVAEIMKSLLDGHILLGRALAERGHFPAIDVVRSISRQSTRLVAPEQAERMRTAAALLADYEENRIMIESGVYKRGSSPRIDRAIDGRDRLNEFLRQPSDEAVTLDETQAALGRLLGAIGG